MAKESLTQRQARAEKIAKLLNRYYPNAECALLHKNPYELLVATVLSAQCTDARVNTVTPVLFKKFPGPKQMAAAPLSEIEEIIRPTGFFKNKALSIQSSAKDIVEKHGGEVPQELDQLVDLRGVGRKTANVVLGVAFGKATGVVVDTHVKRLSNRLALVNSTNPVLIEKQLCELLPRKYWIQFSHCLIHHGRQICKARRPQCEKCFLLEYCPTGQKLTKA